MRNLLMGDVDNHLSTWNFSFGLKETSAGHPLSAWVLEVLEDPFNVGT